jgi:hypothetical protein
LEQTPTHQDAAAAQTRVFLSFSSLDGNIAVALDTHLRSRGLACWTAPRDIAAGADWGAAIVNAIRTSAVLVFILSRNSIHSPHVRRELALARELEIPVVGFRIDGVELPRAIEYYTGRIGWVRMQTDPREVQMDAVVDQVLRTIADGSPIETDARVGTVDAVERGRVTGWLSISLKLFLSIASFGIVAEFAMVINPGDDFSEDDFVEYLLFFLPAHVGMGTAAAILFLNWFASIHSRLAAVGVGALTSRRESIGPGFLVPIRSAFTGARLLQELWRASDPTGSASRLSVGGIGWWMVALAGCAGYTYLAFTASDPEELLPVALLALIATTLLTLAAVGARRFVTAIDRRTHELEQRGSSQDAQDVR